VIDELFRVLSENNSAHEAEKANTFASRYIHRQRLKQTLVVTGRGSENEVLIFNDEFSA